MGTSENGIYTLNLEIRETQENIVRIELQRKGNMFVELDKIVSSPLKNQSDKLTNQSAVVHSLKCVFYWEKNRGHQDINKCRKTTTTRGRINKQKTKKRWKLNCNSREPTQES